MILTAVQPVLLNYFFLDLTQCICRLDLQSSGNLTPLLCKGVPNIHTQKKLYTASDLKPDAKIRRH